MSETTILQEIRLAVGALPGVRIFRNNTGALRDQQGRLIHFGVGGPGGSDLIGWTRHGRFLALEVKTPIGIPTPAQMNFLRAVNAAGGVGAIVRSPAEALRVVSE